MGIFKGVVLFWLFVLLSVEEKFFFVIVIRGLYLYVCWGVLWFVFYFGICLVYFIKRVLEM